MIEQLLDRQDVEGVAPYTPEIEPTLIDLDGDMARIAAALTIRFLRAGLIRRFVSPTGRVRDTDVLTLIGLDLDPNLDASDTRVSLDLGMTLQMVRIEAQESELATRVDRNLNDVGRLLTLSPGALAVLRMGLVTHHVPGMNDVWNLARNSNIEDFSRLTSRALDVPQDDVRLALSKKSPLRRAGLLCAEMGFEASNITFNLSPMVAEVLLREQMDTRGLLKAVARISEPAKLALTDFAHMKCEVETALQYLRAAIAARITGVNILIHGDPGVGKTELARVLAAAAGLQLHEVPTEDRDGDPIEHQQRLGAFTTCQRLLREDTGKAILFDEIEDILPVGDGGMSARRHGNRVIPKGHFNDLLESTVVPTFWVSNIVNHIDTAYLRRFPLIIRVDQLPQRDRQVLAATAFKGIALPAGAIETVAGISALTPALIDSTARVLHLIAGTDPSENLTRLRSMIQNTLSAMGLTNDWKPAQPAAAYRLDWLNPSQPLQPLIDGIARSGRGRICLYGPPGTGKTAFAHHLGKINGRRVIVRRVSDLQSRWAGETEERIAAMFAEAQRDRAILLLDEADSFLAQREVMNQQWQITQINEMLTQMENFEGVFIASTNLVSHLDDASVRRFDFKLRFDPPKPEQRRDMVVEVHNQIMGPERAASVPPVDQAQLGEIDRLHDLTPGDVATARRQCEITERRPLLGEWIALLRLEVEAKRRGASGPIGFVV